MHISNALRPETKGSRVRRGLYLADLKVALAYQGSEKRTSFGPWHAINPGAASWTTEKSRNRASKKASGQQRKPRRHRKRGGGKSCLHSHPPGPSVIEAPPANARLATPKVVAPPHSVLLRSAWST
ncbi:hypothetical protein BCV69DRAFT_281244 [Microstroma glucosiphilum]|uniref:Uncharacterized protein n=1 Tax=Pseudomicrostroma glucosiphilum TaxID=1684307 RepID=A0A316UBK6_9BASI|nr:hypothetical protein BCV69DRAFT_281244 [Pseudomicrostroma glucosiphilum]PWN22234.1 hypothetical protein BCV69DRAFT_281244 [Pseudomicrostroma glucosiphilum]